MTAYHGQSFPNAGFNYIRYGAREIFVKKKQLNLLKCNDIKGEK